MTSADAMTFDKTGALPVDTTLAPDSSVSAASDASSNSNLVNAPQSEPVDQQTAAIPFGEPDAADQVEPSVPNDSEPSPANRYSQVKGPQELFLKGKDRDGYSDVFLQVRCGDEGSVEEINERYMSLRYPMRGMPLPSGRESYGTTEKLFAQMLTTISDQTLLSPRVSGLLAYWVLSTWLLESLPIAPCLVITGSAYEGEVVLRTLKSLCRHPLLLAGVSGATLNGVNWEISPTLLIAEPNLTKRMTAVLGGSTSPGYLTGSGGKYKDYFCPKAIYLGEDLPIHAMPRFSIHINAAMIPGGQRGYPKTLSDSITQSFQNRLVDYRLRNLPAVLNSDFDASELPSDTRAIANALGACVVDAPDLQAALLAVLVPYAEQLLEARSNSLEALVVEATLSLSGQKKPHVFVREIADEANRIQKSRGESPQLSAEMVGLKLRKVGIHTRRLGSGGNGLVMDMKTQTQVSKLAAAYRCGGLGSSDEGTDGPIRTENK